MMALRMREKRKRETKTEKRTAEGERTMKEEKLLAAEAMRQYIVDHLEEMPAAEDVAAAAGYSPRHGARLFREATGRSIGEYIRLLRLSAAARSLAGQDDRVLDVALDHSYDSHEGFTKAFRSAFGISPVSYRKGGRPIPFFIPYPIGLPEKMFTLTGKENKMQNIVTATIVHRPGRKLIVSYSDTGRDYWSYCQEKGCDWEGLLLSIPERLDLPAFLSLPEGMVPAGKAPGAVGVEVPADYAGQLPPGFEIVDLPEGDIFYFTSQPYEDEGPLPKRSRRCSPPTKATAPRITATPLPRKNCPCSILAPSRNPARASPCLRRRFHKRGTNFLLPFWGPDCSQVAKNPQFHSELRVLVLHTG